ncbi:MAG TPA: hypothetical protein VGR57_00100 [Ktedonobacterales bacterium]|nr:hypothetical protein [Ktedonobacterales bacterium]
MSSDDADPPVPDWQLEISDVRAGTPAAAPAVAAGRRRPPRERALRLGATLAALALVVALVLAGTPESRAGLRRLAASLGPPPTATLMSGENVFSFAPNPPGTDVLVDGRVLTVPPPPGSVHPLVLARGRHQLAWRSRLFPFAPIRCTLTVPAATRDTCEFVSLTVVAEERLALQGNVLAARISLETPSPAGVPRLKDAVEQAIAGVAASGTLAPGDHYFYCPQGHECHIATAAGPMRADLSYQWITEQAYPEPCVLGEGIPCRFAGQDCTLLCTVAVTPAAIAGTGPDAARVWTAAVMVQAAWRFTTADGQVILNNVPEMFGAQLMVLRITYDGGGWHVAPVFGHVAGLDAVDDVVCDPLRVWLAQTSWNFMLTQPPPGARARFTSTADPSEGCLAALDKGDKPAYFLQHFGAPLFINDVADNPNDGLDRATTNELAGAEPLYALLGP